MNKNYATNEQVKLMNKVYGTHYGEPVLETFNLRTGRHKHYENEVWQEYDGPDFLGYFKCVKIDGKLKKIKLSQEDCFSNK